MRDIGKQAAPERVEKPDPESVTAIEQQLSVKVVESETGAVRVRTVVHQETTSIPVALRTQRVRIERVQVNRFVDAEFDPRREGDTLVVPVFEYVPVTELKLMLKEEVRISVKTIEETSVHSAEVQRQELVVERRSGTTGDWVAQHAAPSSNDGEQSA